MVFECGRLGSWQELTWPADASAKMARGEGF